MKFYLYVGVLLIIIIRWTSANNQTAVEAEDVIDRRIAVIKFIENKVKTWWPRFLSENENQETFVGRCIGIGKKIRQLLPYAVFFMGAIVTLLGFLTLFSLKTLGLLGLLLVINVSGAVAKITAALVHKKDEKKQNIHLHIHNNKDGYHLEGSSYGWEDRNGKSDPEDDSESYNLYDKLIRNPYYRSYRS